jgi:tellurite resistance protein
MISHHAALVYAMVLVSASDRNMTDAELRTIGDVIRGLPVFADYNEELLPATAASCAELLDDEEGLDKALSLIRSSLPGRLRETAYALGCDVAAADRRINIEELRMLAMLREHLDIDPLVAAAIERAARVRYVRLPAAGETREGRT